jgi:hypothetical protein|tara:strand:- start:279 stop:506 length:228 start_codon:yes stop_codon:yes gene_type:complete
MKVDREQILMNNKKCIKSKSGQVLTEYVIISVTLVLCLAGLWGFPINDEGDTSLDKMLDAFKTLTYYISTVISIP